MALYMHIGSSSDRVFQVEAFGFSILVQRSNVVDDWIEEDREKLK